MRRALTWLRDAATVLGLLAVGLATGGAVIALQVLACVGMILLTVGVLGIAVAAWVTVRLLYVAVGVLMVAACVAILAPETFRSLLHTLGLI